MEQTQLKPVIYVANDRLSRTYKWEQTSDYLNGGIDVISVNDIAKKMDDIVVYDTPNYNQGDVYIRHPYLKGKYMKATREYVDVFEDVFHAMSNIMQYLGVTKMSAKITLEEAYKKVVDGKGNITKGGLGVDFDIKTSKEQLSSKAKKMCIEYANPKVNYQAALNEAHENGLISMPKVETLLKQRNPNGEGSSMTKYTIEVDVSQKMEESLDIALTLKVVKAFKISGNYSESLEKRYKMKYELEIEF